MLMLCPPLWQVSPTMHSAELASCTLGMSGLKGTDEDLWITYEVLDNGELGMLFRGSVRVCVCVCVCVNE